MSGCYEQDDGVLNKVGEKCVCGGGVIMMEHIRKRTRGNKGMGVKVGHWRKGVRESGGEGGAGKVGREGVGVIIEGQGGVGGQHSKIKRAV